MSRPYTKEEIRDQLINNFKAAARHWAKADLTRPEFQDQVKETGETLYRLEGLLHSVLTTLDGCSIGLPAFDLIPSPHPDDEVYYQANDENWYPSGLVINDDCMLHDLLFRK